MLLSYKIIDLHNLIRTILQTISAFVYYATKRSPFNLLIDIYNLTTKDYLCPLSLGHKNFSKPSKRLKLSLAK